MAEHIIEVRVDEKIASVVGDPLYVCGNSDYIVKFHFDAEWAGHETKTARFIKSNKEYIDVLFSGDQCAVPIIDNTPYVRIGVYAGNLCTTTAAIVNAQRSILCGSGVPADPDPDIYAQMLEKLDELYLKDVKSDTEKLGGKPASDYALKSETAPAGYGLGERESKLIAQSDDLDNYTLSGWYQWANAPTHSPIGNYGRMFVSSGVPGSVTQFITSQYAGIEKGVWLMRTRTADTTGWGEWEWMNPPMSLGVEYLTTERYEGKPVYTMLVNCGEMVSGSSVTYAQNVTTIRFAGFAGGVPLPYLGSAGFDGGWTIWMQINGGTIIVHGGSGYANTTINTKAQVWYTKN